jgi:hypothetical protein
MSSPIFSTQKAVRPILLNNNNNNNNSNDIRPITVRRGSNFLGSPSLFHRNHEENFDDDAISSGPFRPVAPLLGVALTGPVEVDAFSHYVREAEALASNVPTSAAHHLLAPPRGSDRSEAAKAVQSAMLGGGKGKYNTSVNGFGKGSNNGNNGQSYLNTHQSNTINSTRGGGGGGGEGVNKSTKQQPFPSTASLLSAFRERLSRIDAEEDVVGVDDDETRAFLSRERSVQGGAYLHSIPADNQSQMPTFNQFSKYSSLQTLGIDPVLASDYSRREKRSGPSPHSPNRLGTNATLLASPSQHSSNSKLDIDELRRAAQQVSQAALQSVAEDVLTGRAFQSTDVAVQAGIEGQGEDGNGNGNAGLISTMYREDVGDKIRTVSPKARRMSLQQQEASKAILDLFINNNSANNNSGEVFEASSLLSSPMPQQWTRQQAQQNAPHVQEYLQQQQQQQQTISGTSKNKSITSSRLFQETAASARKKDQFNEDMLTFQPYKPAPSRRPISTRQQRRSSIGIVPTNSINTLSQQNRKNTSRSGGVDPNTFRNKNFNVENKGIANMRTRRGSLDSSSLSLVAPPKKTMDKLFRNDDPRFSSLYPPTIADSIQKKKELQLLQQLNTNQVTRSQTQTQTQTQTQRTHRIGRPAAQIMRRSGEESTAVQVSHPQPSLESYERDQVEKWRNAAAAVDGPLPPQHLYPLPPGSEGKAVKSLEFLRSLLTSQTDAPIPLPPTNSIRRSNTKLSPTDHTAQSAQAAAAAVSASAATAITSSGGVLGLLERMALSEEQLSIYRSKSSQLEGILKRLTSQLSQRDALEKKLGRNFGEEESNTFEMDSNLITGHYQDQHSTGDKFKQKYGLTGQMGVGLDSDIDSAMSRLYKKLQLSDTIGDSNTTTTAPTSSSSSSPRITDSTINFLSSSSSSSSSSSPTSALEKSEEVREMISKRLEKVHNALSSPNSRIDLNGNGNGGSMSSSTGRDSNYNNTNTISSPSGTGTGVLSRLLTGTSLASAIEVAESHASSMKQRLAAAAMTSPPHLQLQQLLQKEQQSKSNFNSTHHGLFDRYDTAAGATTTTTGIGGEKERGESLGYSHPLAISTPPAPPSILHVPSITTASLLQQHKEAILSSIKVLANPIIPDVTDKSDEKGSNKIPTYYQETTDGSRSSRLALLEGAAANAAKMSQMKAASLPLTTAPLSRQMSSSMSVLPKWAISNPSSPSTTSLQNSTTSTETSMLKSKQSDTVLSEAVAVAVASAVANKKEDKKEKEDTIRRPAISTIPAPSNVRASRVLESFDLLHRMFDAALIPVPDPPSFEQDDSIKSVPPMREAPPPPPTSSTSAAAATVMQSLRATSSRVSPIKTSDKPARKSHSHVSFEDLEESASKQFDEKIESVASRVSSRLGPLPSLESSTTSLSLPILPLSSTTTTTTTTTSPAALDYIKGTSSSTTTTSSSSSLAPVSMKISTGRRSSLDTTSSIATRKRQAAANEAFVNRMNLASKGQRVTKVQPFSHLAKVISY